MARLIRVVSGQARRLRPGAVVSLTAARVAILLPRRRGAVRSPRARDSSAAILDIAALSFLGPGATAPSPEWGAMLTDAFKAGFGVFVTGQHAVLFPGIAIALSVLAVNFISDGPRDALDPRRKL